MTDSCDSAKKVPYAAPPYPHILRDRPMLCNNIRKLLVYVLSPIDIIAIRRIRQPREKSELQMIVRVDKTRHNQEAA